ncbi:MAG: circularly permuted type 2 ATP-grasp protein [Candidatus Acidiferrales bacterium]
MAAAPLQEVRRGLFEGYDTGGFYDEMFSAPGRPRPHYSKLLDKLGAMAPQQFEERRKLADLSFLIQGITFTVYSDGQGTERLFPFDLIPRILARSEWERIERGLAQRVMALNLFLQDVYGKQVLFKDRVIPRSLVYSCPNFRREVIGVEVSRGIYTHICGIDLVRDSKTGEFCVLEDNVRTPSGISYVLENRLVMTRVLPDAFQACEVLPVNHYPAELSRILRSLSPRGEGDAQIALLTPGIYNSAYFEHSFLAQQMGIELVEGRDLIVDGGLVYTKTIHGLKRVDVIYRRVDDLFLDSLTFRTDSLLGVPGLMGACRAGNVALANAVGNGVADDKGIYSYIPAFIRYYLGEEPVLRSVETYLCANPADLAYVLEHLPELVVKAVGESGGYGMLIGPAADQAKIGEFRERIRANPRNYIAQPVVPLSRVPSYDPSTGCVAGRHVDLRPYCLYDGQKVTIVPGGLTRVALQRGSLVVNSSQGGGSKDTWVLRGEN